MGLSKSKQQTLFEWGYTAKGVVYSLIGFFAVATLIGISRGATGPKDVIAWLGNNPAGQILLTAIGLGLLCYCSYRWYTAVKDTENEGHDASGSVKRVGWAVSGTAYGVLAVFAFKEAFAGGGSTGGKETMIAKILEYSWGQFAVYAIAAIMVGVAIYQVYRGVADKHMEGVKDQQLSDETEEAFRTTGRIGLVARSIVYGIIAYFLYQAAMQNDAGEFRGIQGALEYLGDGWGNAVLAVVGTGLLAYGIFMFVRAKYERV
ncbi:DUF1206 domain-containing protein [Lewinella sp. 4G2]|uniref:DUF1206 domain-containing protein n=1 Tax=Lewinella sp. 4G2 TaxID=1803372 RepID=UPI0007B47487|nr:DUF1206 domain-containing protein [Lewinella sp. 4G2]OAV46259.1 hypothetical protein A3850_018560 [Lewinella sp. 4G2]